MKFFGSTSPVRTTLVAFLLMVMLVTPTVGQAQTTTQFRPQSNQELLAYLYGQLVILLAQLEALQRQQATQTTYRPVTTSSSQYNPYFVQAVSLAPKVVDRTSAELLMEVDKGGSTAVDAWIEYGSGSRLTRTTTEIQITRTGRRTLTFPVTNLLSDTTYSYRAVVEDEDRNRIYGQVRQFSTVAPASTLTFTGSPVAETEGVVNVRSTSATVRGFVSMNDFEGQGTVFVVYGTDRSQVEDADAYDAYAEIPVAKGTVAKKVVNSRFTGRNTVSTSASSLTRATRHYYRVCVQYGETRTRLRCGEVESFTTLN